MNTDLKAAVDRLGAAFLARDLDAALGGFVADLDIAYAGSEAGEKARGREAVAALLGELFTRAAAYGWTAGELWAHRRGAQAHVLVEATGVQLRDDGAREEFPYRLSGILERVGDHWLWRVCTGSEPTSP